MDIDKNCNCCIVFYRIRKVKQKLLIIFPKRKQFLFRYFSVRWPPMGSVQKLGWQGDCPQVPSSRPQGVWSTYESNFLCRKLNCGLMIRLRGGVIVSSKFLLHLHGDHVCPLDWHRGCRSSYQAMMVSLVLSHPQGYQNLGPEWESWAMHQLWVMVQCRVERKW